MAPRRVFRHAQAEIAGEYLKKGRQVYVEGRLQTRKWQDKEGQEKYTTEIVADRMQMLGSRDGAAAVRAVAASRRRERERRRGRRQTPASGGAGQKERRRPGRRYSVLVLKRRAARAEIPAGPPPAAACDQRRDGPVSPGSAGAGTAP